ncbi:DUF134 domain-containing protein [bacterium]|nr:DUF134 domain-containing protein [bacterium]
MSATSVTLPRPHKQRQIAFKTDVRGFKPLGIPMRDLDTIELTADEIEALRLAHLEGFYQVAIARHMNVSRQTVARILDSAHRKVTEALVEGKALAFSGGPVEWLDDAPERCPRCGGRNGQGRGQGRGRGRGRRRGFDEQDDCECPADSQVDGS